jgi:exosome complex RNA-binding protein Csl4
VVVAPGDRLGVTHDYRAGEGTYVRGSHIYASVVGVQVVRGGDGDGDGGGGGSAASSLPQLCVQRAGDGVPLPQVGSIVMGRVMSINPRTAQVHILFVDGVTVRLPYSGVIRKENVLASEIDRVGMEQCCRPGDIIIAEVGAATALARMPSLWPCRVLRCA